MNYYKILTDETNFVCYRQPINDNGDMDFIKFYRLEYFHYLKRHVHNMLDSTNKWFSKKKCSSLGLLIIYTTLHEKNCLRTLNKYLCGMFYYTVCLQLSLLQTVSILFMGPRWTDRSRRVRWKRGERTKLNVALNMRQCLPEGLRHEVHFNLEWVRDYSYF